jgi:hypothetical protein
MPIPTQTGSYAWFGIGIRDRMSRRKAKHVERQDETALSPCRENGMIENAPQPGPGGGCVGLKSA